MSYELYNADCLDLMREIKDGSVDAIITDPPYYSTELFFDKASRIDFKDWLVECRRVLKPNGVLVSFCDLNLLIELKEHKAFKSSYELIWEKTAFTGFLDANRRPLKGHEYLFITMNGLNKSTYNPQKSQGKTYKEIRLNGSYSSVYGKYLSGDYSNNTGDRHPSTVLKFSHDTSRSNTKCRHTNTRHPTQKPIALCEWLINTYSNKDDVILDPFMGSGTIGLACKNLERKFIGCELHKPYFDMAQQRINNS